jgi:hypothetical protein
VFSTKVRSARSRFSSVSRLVLTSLPAVLKARASSAISSRPRSSTAVA